MDSQFLGCFHPAKIIPKNWKMMQIVQVLLILFANLIRSDKVPQYSGSAGGFPGYAADAAQDAFNALGEAIPGEPGEDYPIYSEVPDTSFTCDGQVEGGYYADPEAECQAFHICGGGLDGSLIKYSFLCPNGSLFNQEYFVCDWWFNVDCSLAEDFYSLNDEIAAERAANSPGGLGQYGGGAAGTGGQGSYQGGQGRGGNTGSGYSGSASSVRQDYAVPDAGYSAPTGAGSGYSAPLQGYAGKRTARNRNGRRGKK